MRHTSEHRIHGKSRVSTCSTLRVCVCVAGQLRVCVDWAAPVLASVCDPRCVNANINADVMTMTVLLLNRLSEPWEAELEVLVYRID